MTIQRLYPLIFLCTLPAIAADSDPALYQQTAASYRLYGGSLGDPTAPKPNDRKIAFTIEGDAARGIFDAIGPDKRDLCTAGSGMRVRHKDGEKLTCTRSKANNYVCSFGFDLMTGKSIGGGIC
ncbi:hypothetical protein AB2N08_17440 [Massilia aurea]|uniref:hypothetical protein n=1 Tax=Massilia aurea TaxID=373040 RepID=UPI0034626B01